MRCGQRDPAGAGADDDHALPAGSVRPRPKSLTGVTYQVGTPLGTAYVTINTNGQEQPFEVFLNVGKAGSDTAAIAEAIGRLISLNPGCHRPWNHGNALARSFSSSVASAGASQWGSATTVCSACPTVWRTS